MIGPGLRPITRRSYGWAAGLAGPVFTRAFASGLGAGSSFTRATTGTYLSDAAGTVAAAASGAARFSFFGSLAGLLIEPIAVNLVTRSQQFDLWTGFNAPVVLADMATAPDGTATAETVTAVSVAAYLESANATAVNGSQYIFSVWSDADQATTVKQAIIDLANGVPNVVQTISLTTAWQRFVTALFTADAEQSVGARVGGPGGAGFPVGRTLKFWGAQVELMAGAAVCPTSYIATTTGAVQRNSDQLSYAMPAGTLPGSGTVSCWCSLPWTPDTGGRVLVDLGGVGNAGLCVYGNGSGAVPKLVYGSGGAAVTVTASAALSGANAWSHVLATWSPSGGVLWVNGANVGSSGTAPAIALNVNLNVGSLGLASGFWGGGIRGLNVWGRVLSNAEIAAQFAAGA